MLVTRCTALRRDGRECGALASSPTATYCRRHEELAEEQGHHAVRSGTTLDAAGRANQTPLPVEAMPTATIDPSNAATTGSRNGDRNLADSGAERT
jgi:hypothetical protein